jgi:ATP-dependent DNA helicase UvrD/PcrA
MVADGLLDGLNQAQRRAVTSPVTPLCILAGAGSGKTRVLTRRIAWRVADGSADARHVLALTFTRKAAGELSSRLTALGVREQVAAGTFHAIAYAQLRRRWADRGERPPALLDRKVRLLAPLLSGHRRAAVQPADVAAEIEWAKARGVSPAQYETEAHAAGRQPALTLSVLASLYERYEEEKRRKGLVDFEDLLLLCARALETDDGFGDAQRWRFRHLFVDEFQDVNPVQFRLLEGWRGDRADLCVVGDPNQAIFGWNGADATYLTAFAERFAGAEVVRLDDNYRSSPQILAVADAVLAGASDRSRPLRPNRPDASVPTVRSWATDRDEARAVARAMRRRQGPSLPWSAMAVLARTNAQLVLFEEALTAAGIPHRVRGEGAFLSQPEVREALNGLRTRPLDSALAPVIVDLEEIAAEGEGDRRQRLEGLVRLAREHVSIDQAASIESFFAWLRATVGGDEPARGGDVVELATFHAAKGLEWPLVFVVGLERGLVPIAQADTPQARAEERRLLYVAVTRAQRELHCSWAERRTFGSRSLTRTPSAYLPAIEAAVKAGDEGTPGDWRRFLDDGRAKLRAAAGTKRPGTLLPLLEGADPMLFEALKTWRASTARASGVPAYVIFHDTTLAALAQAKPSDRTGLLAVPGLGPVKAERYGEAVLAVLSGAAS